MELALNILECCLKQVSSFTPEDLSKEANVSETKARCVLLTLQKRGYLKKIPNTEKYMLTKKIMMLL